jgi:glyoxylate reductase
LPNLRLVANYGAGYELVDVEACRSRGVLVTNTPGVTSAATADLTLGLLLALRRRIAVGDDFVRSGQWDTAWADEPLKGDEVAGSTLGIVGLGRIGQAVAQRARGFEMRVLYTRRTPDSDSAHRTLEQLLSEADIVSIHLPLTDETRGLIDARRLALMRDGSALINTARGQIVDEPALVTELVSGRLQAGLDVFAHEPQVPPELFRLPNVVMTPHLGTATQATREAMTRVLVDNLLAVKAGDPLPNAV